MAGRGGVGFRKPDVQGHEPGLGPEADHGEHEGDAGQPGPRVRQREAVEIERAALAADMPVRTLQEFCSR